MVSLTYTSAAQRAQGYNGGEIHSNPKEDSLKDRYIGQGPLAAGKAKRAVDCRQKDLGVLSIPFSHSGAGRVEEPHLFEASVALSWERRRSS